MMPTPESNAMPESKSVDERKLQTWRIRERVILYGFMAALILVSSLSLSETIGSNRVIARQDKTIMRLDETITDLDKLLNARTPIIEYIQNSEGKSTCFLAAVSALIAEATLPPELRSSAEIARLRQEMILATEYMLSVKKQNNSCPVTIDGGQPND